MKKILFFFLVAFTSSVFSENTIIAIVNNTPIALNSVQINLNNSYSQEEKIIIINKYIDNIVYQDVENQHNFRTFRNSSTDGVRDKWFNTNRFRFF